MNLAQAIDFLRKVSREKNLSVGDEKILEIAAKIAIHFRITKERNNNFFRGGKNAKAKT